MTLQSKMDELKRSIHSIQSIQQPDTGLTVTQPTITKPPKPFVPVVDNSLAMSIHLHFTTFNGIYTQSDWSRLADIIGWKGNIHAIDIAILHLYSMNQITVVKYNGILRYGSSKAAKDYVAWHPGALIISPYNNK